MKKKFLMLFALGLAASVQAQNAPAAAAPAAQPTPAAAPVAQPAPAAEPAPVAAANTAEPVAEPAPVAEAAPAADATAAAAPEQVATDSATAAPASDAAAAAPAPAADSTTVAAEAAPTADSAATTAPEVAVADSVASADSATVAATDSLAQDTSKVAKAPANKLGDILHGNAYNTVGNEAAAATIGGNLSIPHFMHGSKLVYFDPLDEQGVVSFGDRWTYFLAFRNAEAMGNLTAGIAFEKFGASLDYSLGKHWRHTDHADGTEETSKRTTAGSAVGGTFSVNLGSFDIVLNGVYATPNENRYLDQPYNTVEEDAWAAYGYLGVSYSGDAYYWTIGVEGERNEFKHKTKVSEIIVENGKTKKKTTKTTMSDTLANIMISPAFSLGTAVLSSQNANVYLGVNTYVPMRMYDEIESICDKHLEAAMLIEPNILGEVQFSKYFMAFGGASYEWKAAEYTDRELNKEETKVLDTSVGATDVNIGVRFEYGPAALEMSFEKVFMGNPFGSFSTTDEMVSSLGAFIYF